MSAEYRDLPKLVGKLKLAAIDAYMVSKSRYKIDKGRNVYYESGNFGSQTMELTITRPGSNGEGGGVIQVRRDDGTFPQNVKFKEIRDDIDDIVRPWLDLPNPYSDGFKGKINEYREKVAAVLSETSIEGLDPTTKTTDVSTVKLQSFDKIAPGRMRTLLKGMNDYASALEGSAFNTFRATFVTSMPSVIGNLALLARVHGETLLAEQLFLKQLRKKVVEAVEKATDAFEEIAEGEDGVGFEILLNILIWGCMAATVPGSGAPMAARIAGGASVPLTVLKDVSALKHDKTAGKATFEADNFEEMMKEFKRAFEEIGDDFKTAEEAVDENLRHNMKLVLEDRARHGYTDTFFHLTPAPIQDAAGATRMDENAVNQMTVGDGATGGYMSQIAAELEKAAKALTGISMVDLVRRKHNIGMGPTGPGGAFAELRQVLYELLQDLRWKVDEGNVNLRAAMRDFQESDASSQKALDAVASNIAQGAGWTPGTIRSRRRRTCGPTATATSKRQAAAPSGGRGVCAVRRRAGWWAATSYRHRKRQAGI